MRATASLVVASAILMAGCPKVPDLGKLPKVPGEVKEYLPEIRFAKVKFDGVSFDGVDATFVFDVDNPYPVDLKLASFDWALALDGTGFLDGASTDGFDLKATSSSKLRVPARINFADAFALVTGGGPENDTWTMGMSGKAGFDTPLGKVDVPFQRDEPLPRLKAPKIKPAAARVDGVNLLNQTANLSVDLDVKNRGGGGLGFTGFGYQIGLMGTEVAVGDLADMEGVATDETRTVTIPIELRLLDLGTSIAGAITRKEQVDVSLGGQVTVQTPLGPVPLNLDESKRLSLK